VLGAIHNFAEDIEVLERSDRAEYRPGLAVRDLAEDGAGVRIGIQRADTGELVSETFDRVFVGAGAIGTTRIMLESLKLFDRPVVLKDSQKFVLPFLRWRRTRREWPDINTLSAVFCEVKLPELSDHWIHMQISTVNDYVLARLGIPLDGKTTLRSLLLAPGIDRLMVAWCGLHSDHSSSIEMRLLPRQRSGRHVLAMDNVANPDAAKVARRTAWAMARAGLRFRALFLAPFLTLSGIGSGSHVGGTFPMSMGAPSAFSTDLLGRPAGWRRVHLIDASTFPSIPGTTLALLIMANADRIATLSPLD
jgi:hypothetical protein